VVQGSSPLIWRRLLIRRDVCLATPHATRQIVFARSEVHLHDFRIREGARLQASQRPPRRWRSAACAACRSAL